MPLNFSRELLQSCQNGLERIKNCKKDLEHYTANAAVESITAEEKEKLSEIDAFRTQFEAAMDDDFNTADAVTAIYELVRYSNKAMKEGVSREFAKKALDEMVALCEVLGLNRQEEEKLRYYH